jgi:selenocysteine lyase/cysteine desulfurase
VIAMLDKDFGSMVLNLLKQNQIPVSDTLAVKVVAALSYLQQIPGLRTGLFLFGVPASQKVSDALSGLLTAYKANASSSDHDRTGPVLTRAFNIARDLVGDFLQIADLREPTFPRN